MVDWQKEEWLRVDRLFAEVLEHPVEERARFLDDSDESPEVVARVRRLLERESAAAGRIGESAEAFASDLIAASAADSDDDLAPGSVVGPYTILGELGRGGMGTVYRAERTDGQHERQVAIKVIKRGMDTDEILRRFRREGRILSRLEHPGIARMYEADVTEDGRPFLVLERLEGRPIDEHCDHHTLSVDDRIRLFMDVCGAVSHAHAKLILHRDIKPSNILVTEAGPKLLDFGVGAILDDDAATVSLTERAGRRLTPAYASPEQMRGEDISTESDVYSLGVVLFELLTGSRPESGGTTRASSVVSETLDPAETTTVAESRDSTPARLSKRLRGDLDVILMKALHPDIDRRYPSVEAFSEDLRRHLLGFPVEARPDSVVYRARKFVRRNRVPVASSSSLVGAILLFAVMSALQEAETARERDRADLERARAEQVASVLESMFTGADFNTRDRIDTLTVRQFIERSSTEILGELDGQPVVQGTLMRILGAARGRLGDMAGADSLLGASVEVLESASPLDEVELLNAKRDLAQVRHRLGRFDESRALYAEVFEAGVLDGDPDGRAEAYHNVAIGFIDTGQYDSAAVLFDTALAIHRTNPSPNALGFAATLTMRGGVAQRMGDLPTALSLSREAWDVMVEELGPEHPNVMVQEHNYAFVLLRSGDTESALPIFEGLVERARDIGAPPDMPTLLINLASARRSAGQPREAIAPIEESIALTRSRLGPDHPDLVFAYDALGMTHEDMEDDDGALAAYEQAVGVSLRTGGPDHPGTAVSRGKAVATRCRLGAGTPASLANDFEEVRGLIERAFPAEHPATSDFLVRMGDCQLRIGRPAEARETLETAHRTLRAIDGPAALIERVERMIAEAEAGGR